MRDHLSQKLDPKHLRSIRRAAMMSGWRTASIAALALAGVVPAAATTIHYYEFENDVADSGSAAQPASVLAGAPAFSGNTPSDILGLGDIASVQLGVGDALSFSYPFPFNSLTDATLEFFVHPDALGMEQDLLWTTTGPGDTNRFNLALSGPGSMGLDYRDSSGTLHSLGAASGLVANQWNFIAIVKRGNTYALHVNDLPAVIVSDSNPNLPTSAAWTINGRAAAQPLPGVQFSGRIDAVRISDQALNPSEFLNVGAIFRDGFD